MLMLPAVAVAFAVSAQVPVATPEPEPAEAVVAASLEELRKAELLLDADALDPLIAHSFTSIEEGTRLAGSFAFLEPIRRLRERKAEVKELEFDDISIDVFGASAVATYRYHKVWTDRGTRHHEAGWTSDIFERRDDGAWILVHRHRSR
jgi:hypothetical protein